MMRVIILTPHLDHPYVSCLVRSLQREQVDVRIGRIRRFLQPLFAIVQHGWPAVFHVQWQHYLFVSESLLLSSVKSALWFLQWAVLRLLGIRFVWTVHNIVNHERIHEAWEMRMCRLWGRCADAVIVHCAEAAAQVATAYDLPRAKISVIPHGHFVDVYGAPVAPEAARASIGIPAGAILFLCFGQVKPYKGLNTLLRVFETGHFGRNAHLLIAGSAPDLELRSHIAALADRSDAVTAHLRYIEDEHVPAYLSSCDAVVLPYTRSLTSGVAVLAASFGRPIIASRVGCLHDWPQDTGIFYDPDAPDGLRRALDHALTADLTTMGQNNRRHTHTQLNWDNVARQTRATYVQVRGR